MKITISHSMQSPMSGRLTSGFTGKVPFASGITSLCKASRADKRNSDQEDLPNRSLARCLAPTRLWCFHYGSALGGGHAADSLGRAYIVFGSCF